MGVDEDISEMEALLAQTEYVESGQYVYARHPALFVDFLKYLIDAVKLLYDEFKNKTGRTLPDVESYIDMAENRYSFARKPKTFDLVLTKDHNVIIDTFKPLELALRRMEEEL